MAITYSKLTPEQKQVIDNLCKKQAELDKTWTDANADIPMKCQFENTTIADLRLEFVSDELGAFDELAQTIKVSRLEG